MGSGGDFQLEISLIENTNLLAAGWLDPTYWWGVAQVVIGLGLVIFVHELGHFLVAKACGVKCEKFYVGFDAFEWKWGDRVIIPKALVKYQWGETEYGVGILPLGGYVKMLGQDDNPANMEKEIERSKLESADGEELYEPSGLVDRTKMDPRSFIAKTVPQRMAIISAGVIFNLLFAIVLGAIAFRSGVNYEPAMIGNVTPGGPAWEAGLGESEVVRVGDQKIEGEYFTFINMAEKIIFDGSEDGANVELEYIPVGETESKVVELTPRQIGKEIELPRLGVQSRMALKVAKEAPTIDGRGAANPDAPVLADDVITHTNGVAVETMGQFQAQLAKSYGKDIQLKINRMPENAGKNATPELVELTIAPDRVRTLGLHCQWLPVAAVKKGSPAEKAGFLVGDEIVSINGRGPGSLYELDVDAILHMREKKSEPMVFVVNRKQHEGEAVEKVTLNVVPVMPKRVTVIEGAEPIGVESLGLAIPTSNIVSFVKQNGPAYEAGIQVGDEIIGTQSLLTPEQAADPFFARAGRKRDYLDGVINFNDTRGMAQQFPLGQKFELFYKRGEESKSATLTTVESDEYYLPTIGIRLTPYQETYVAESWGQAFKLGAYQTWVDLTKVFKFLGKLVRGRISAKNLGGPGTIFVVAQSEASQGTSRLLLFLVLLSANLAIVNFLPIPVLDGGHMMFLAYEGLFRKPVTEKVQLLLTYVGFLALLALMAFVIWQDIGRISKLF